MRWMLMLLIAGCGSERVIETRKEERSTVAIEQALRGCLEHHHVAGTIAVRIGDRTVCSDAACNERHPPASTFKIVNTLIGLETGVLSGVDHAMTWDGTHYDIEAWNHDHTLESAFHDSVVWYYQRLAREVGMERMRRSVAAFDYGNRQLGAQVDQFWLEGPLAISPVEQAELMQRITTGRVPASARSLAILERIMRIPESRYELYAKTGSTFWGQPGELRWYVGYARLDGEVVSFATLLFPARSEADAASLRRPVSECALAATRSPGGA